MGQLEFVQNVIEGWIINPNEHGLLDSPGNAMCLPTISGETVHSDVVPRGVTMFIDGDRGPEVLL